MKSSSLLFSRQCEYALQAILYLATKEDGEHTSIKELTEQLRIPYHFLGKILQALTHTGLLLSHKGPTGGFALGMPAEDITLLHIVEAVDGVDFMHTCVLGFPVCSGENPCSVHNQWAAIREGLYKMLAGKNINELALKMEKPGYHEEAVA